MARRPVPAGQTPPSGPAHMLGLVRDAIPPLHPKGLPFVLGPLAVAALGRKQRVIRTLGVAGAAACAAFFRHPARVTPIESGLVVAPADGEVCLVDTAVPPAELGLGDQPRPRVSIFLSVLDVHVQRTPVTGVVEKIVHTPGKFLSADLSDASEVNERNSVLLRTDDGAEVAVVQIAGLIARRIVCEVSVGDRLAAGETYGLIRFGSRVDTYLPVGTEPLVWVGQRAVGAETPLARIAGEA